MYESGEVKVLLIDDEENILSFLKMGLEAEDFKVYCAKDGESGLELAKKVVPEVIVLDVMIPKMNGYQVCREIKSVLDTQVIMLTARDGIEDKIKGLNLGADDYMVKPFSFMELVARIKARLRGKVNEGNKVVKVGEFFVDDEAHEIRYKDNLLPLTPTEYNLLIYLLDNRGKPLSKTKILNKIWGYDYYGDDNIVEVYIRYLRNKIKDSEHMIIQTIRGIGYKVVCNE